MYVNRAKVESNLAPNQCWEEGTYDIPLVLVAVYVYSSCFPCIGCHPFPAPEIEGHDLQKVLHVVCVPTPQTDGMGDFAAQRQASFTP